MPDDEPTAETSASDDAVSDARAANEPDDTADRSEATPAVSDARAADELDDTADRGEARPAVSEARAANELDDTAGRSEARPAVSEAELAAAEAAQAAEAAEVAARAALKRAKKAKKQAERMQAEAARLAHPDADLAPDADAAPAPEPVSIVKPADTTDTASPTDDASPTDGVVADAPPERRFAVPVVLTALLAVVALAFAVFSVVTWFGTGSGSGSSDAAARDAALLAARQDIVVLNTLDYRSLDTGLRNWADASTGTLHDSLSNVSASDKTAITKAADVTTAKVIDAALTDLSASAGSATVIASVQVHVAPANGKPVTKRDRLTATMTRVNGIWKVSALSQVGVTLP